MSEIYVTIIVAVLSSGLFGFLWNIVSSFINRRKEKANTSTVEIDNLTRLQELVEKSVITMDGLISRNIKVDVEREKERDAKRIELNLLKNEVLTLQITSNKSITELVELHKIISEKDQRINSLEKVAMVQGQVNVETAVALDEIKQKTGPLPARDGLKKKA